MRFTMLGSDHHPGPVLLSDDYSSVVGNAKQGVAASQKALYDAYSSLNSKFNWSQQTIANGRAGITIGNTQWHEMVASVVFGKNTNFGFTFHVLRAQIQLEKNTSGLHHYIQGSYISTNDNHMCALEVTETSARVSYYKYCGADVNEACRLSVFVR